MRAAAVTAPAAQRLIVEPDATLMGHAAELRRIARRRRDRLVGVLVPAAERIEQVAQSYAELAAAFARKVSECAQLRAEIEQRTATPKRRRGA